MSKFFFFFFTTLLAATSSFFQRCYLREEILSPSFFFNVLDQEVCDSSHIHIILYKRNIPHSFSVKTRPGSTCRCGFLCEITIKALSSNAVNCHNKSSEVKHLSGNNFLNHFFPTISFNREKKYQHASKHRQGKKKSQRVFRSKTFYHDMKVLRRKSLFSFQFRRT